MSAVELQPHDPAWATEFDAECARLHALMGDAIGTIEHIGSTAIPGLVAKPVIDILVIARTLAAIDACAPALVAAGYEAKGEYGLSGRRYFRKSAPDGRRTHHIHVYQQGDPAIRRHLAFRDYLRAQPRVAADYGALKQRLAARPQGGRDDYQQAKSGWVSRTEAVALAWLAAGAD